MTIESIAPHASQSLTYEQIAERILVFLAKRGFRLGRPHAIPWDAFTRLSDRIHENYHVPSTTVTPMMRRLLFAIGCAASAQQVVGIGTYVAYAFSWLLRDRSDDEAAPFCDRAVGVDIDPEANRIARENCQRLAHGKRLDFYDADGVPYLKRRIEMIDLLFIDVDSMTQGKSDYQHILNAAIPRLNPGSIVLAHDPLVPRFRSDFDAYHTLMLRSSRFLGPWVLPVDRCGLSIAVVK